MKYIDISHPFGAATPVYPGSEPPAITQEFTIENNGFNEKHLSFFNHSGTHIDAPAHMLTGGATIDSLDISHFTGRGYAIDVSGCSNDNIDVTLLLPHREKLVSADFLVLHSGWHRYSSGANYYSGYPVLSDESAEWIAGFNLKGIGVDMISVDHVQSTDYRNHMTFFSRNMIIIENLKGTEQLIGREFILYVFPLNITGGDGSPVRAVAAI